VSVGFSENRKLVTNMNNNWQPVPIEWQEYVRFEPLDIRYVGFRDQTSHLPLASGEKREKQLRLKLPAAFTLQCPISRSRSATNQASNTPHRCFTGFQALHQATSWEENYTSKLNKSQDSTMKTLIIYQDFAFAVKANAALQHAAQYSDIRVQWNIRPWRVDLLKFPLAAEEALADALDAHLIVFGSRCAHSFPFWLENWLEQWAKCRQIKDVALAVIHEDSADPLPALATTGLSYFATRHGLNFIFDVNLVLVPSSIGPSQNSRPRDAHYQGWGINE
jgi:hypothetical protein